MKRETQSRGSPGLLVAVVMGLVSLMALSAAQATTYTLLPRTVGANGTVTGTIETDGTLGQLIAANVVDWNLTLTNGGDSVNITAANSGHGGVGINLHATASELYMNFTGAVGGLGFCFQACAFGRTEWVFQGDGTNGYLEVLRYFPNEPNQEGIRHAAGLHLLGTAGGSNAVPLPAAAWLFLAGIGGLAGMKRRKAA